MIATTVRSAASAATVHDLLVDVDAWSVWSPHVASVDARTRRLVRPNPGVLLADRYPDDGRHGAR